MLETLRKRFIRRKNDQSDARCRTYRQFVMLAAEDELNIAKADFDHDELLSLLDREGLTLADFEANVETVKQRIAWAALAEREQKLLADSHRLDAEWRAFDIAETQRHREALKKLEAMKAAAKQASDAYLDSFDAVARLRATTAPVINLPELNRELVEINEKITAAEMKLDEHDKADDASYHWSDAGNRPARLARQCKAALASMNAQSPAEQRRELESRLAVAERAAIDARNELVKLRNQRETLYEKLKVGPDDWKRPENFAIVRTTRSRDEQAKQRAKELDWDNESAVRASDG